MAEEESKGKPVKREPNLAPVKREPNLAPVFVELTKGEESIIFRYRALKKPYRRRITKLLNDLEES